MEVTYPGRCPSLWFGGADQIPTLLLLSTVGMKCGGNEAPLSSGRLASTAGDMANRNAPRTF